MAAEPRVNWVSAHPSPTHRDSHLGVAPLIAPLSRRGHGKAYGGCPACGRVYALRADGRVRLHAPCGMPEDEAV